MEIYLYLLLAGIPLYLAAKQDAREGIAYDRWWISITIIAVIGTAMEYQSPIGLIYGFVAIGCPLLLYAYLDGNDGIGGGDVKICASVGAVIGVLGGYIVIFIAMLLFILMMLLKRKSHGPFIPSLFFSYLIYIVIRSTINDF